MPRGTSNRMRAVERVKPGIHENFFIQLILAIIRWLPEIVVAIAVITLFVWLVRQDLPAWAAACVLVTPVSLLLAVPTTRRGALAVWWCNVTRHRLRSFFSETGIRNRSWRLPILCVIYPSKMGEVAWVALPAGFSASDVGRNGQEQLAAACYARDARIAPGKKWSNMLRLEVIRHEPWGTEPIRSPLVKKGDEEIIPPGVSGAVSVARPEVISSVGKPVPDSTDQTTVEPGGKVADLDTTKKSRKSQAQTAPGIVTSNGEDISDYV